MLLLPLLLISILLSSCAAFKVTSGFDDLQANNFDGAILKCTQAMESNEEPSLVKRDGSYRTSMEFYSTMCIAAAFFGKGDFENSKKYWFANIKSSPQKGYIAYASLASMSYMSGDLEKAHYYSRLGRDLVESENYIKENANSSYDINMWKDGLTAAEQYYHMRLDFKKMTEEYEKGEYKNAITIGNSIIDREFLVHSGTKTVANNVIASVEKGSLDDLNGILPGDKILEVDGVAIVDLKTLAKVGQKLSHSYGSTSTAKIERKGRIISLTIQLVYPEVDTAKKLIEDAKTALASSTKGKKKIAGPWLKVLEPKTARGVKIVGNVKAEFRILGSDVDSLKKVTINGQLCNELNPSLLESTMLPGKVMMYTLSLPLSQGKNKFDIVAINNKGKETLQKIEVNGTAASLNELTQFYKHRVAVVIGINKYYPWPSLEFAVNDAKSIKNRLLKMGFDKVIELYDTEATRARIMRTLMDDLPTLMGPEDCLFVFFGGHGATEDLADGGKEGYIMPVDADVTNFQGTGISMSSIHEMIKRYKAKHILFVFDSCYSGLGLKRSGGVHTAKIDGFLKSMAQKPTSLILTAGGKNEQATEEKGHGIFTKSFLDVLDGDGVASHGGFILASDIAQQVRKKVHDKSGGKQIPQFGILAGEGDFIFEVN